MRIRCSLITLTAALALGGCREQEYKPGTALPAAETLVPPPTRPVPPLLSDVQATTLSLQDSIAAENWTAARRMASSLQHAGGALRQAGAPPTDVARFESNVEAVRVALSEHNALEASLAANRAARCAVLMSEAYTMDIPAAALLLPVDARDVHYAAERADWPLAAEAATALENRYREIESTVEAEDPALDRRMEYNVQALQEAVSRSDLQRVRTLTSVILRDSEMIERLSGT